MPDISTFGVLSDGRTVQAIRLTTGDLTVRLLDYGARVVEYRRGDGPNVHISSDTIADYETRLIYAGPIVGPVINRIGGAKATIGGEAYTFDANQLDRHTLHSGRTAAHNLIWDIAAQSTSAVTFSLTHQDGFGGFPGNRSISATYRLEDGGLTLLIEAQTDAPTLMNPGSHGVWNADGTTEWTGHTLHIPSERYLPTSSDAVPTGDIDEVAGTIFDHRSPREPDPTLDHNYCFDTAFGLRARLTGAKGHALEIYSDAPGLQAYAGGSEGIALEPQLWPDAPNNPHFPSIHLRPGEVFRQTSRFLIIP